MKLVIFKNKTKFIKPINFIDYYVFFVLNPRLRSVFVIQAMIFFKLTYIPWPYYQTHSSFVWIIHYGLYKLKICLHIMKTANGIWHDLPFNQPKKKLTNNTTYMKCPRFVLFSNFTSKVQFVWFSDQIVNIFSL